MKLLSVVLLFSGIIILQGCADANKQSRIEASGTIEATNVIVSSRVSGEVLQLAVDEGGNVNPGDTLLYIDNEMLTIQLKQAEAGKDIAEAQLSMLKNGARREDVSQTEEILNQAKINYTSAKQDYERMRNLYDSKSITKKQFDDASARVHITEAQLKAARENLNRVKNFARPEELKQSEANLRKAEASCDLLKKNIRDTYVTSPIKGIVVRKFVEKGENVNPAASLFKISDLGIVDLIIYVSEEELGFVKLGQKADISIDAYRDKIYTGEIVFISPEAEFTPKNIQTKDERTKLVFAVKIRIKNPAYELKPGMPADAVIHL